MDSCSGRRKQQKTVGIVHLKVFTKSLISEIFWFWF